MYWHIKLTFYINVIIPFSKINNGIILVRLKSLMNKFFFILLFILSAYSLPVLAQEKIKIAVRENFSLSKEYIQTLTEAYKRIGQPVEFIYLPGGSSLKYSNTGELGIDGEAGRLVYVLKAYKNLRKVPEPIYPFEMSLFTNKKDLNVRGWSDLKNLQVTTRIGFKHIINKMEGMNLRVVKDSLTAMSLVEKNRADVAILPKGDGLTAIEKHGLKNVYMLKKPIEIHPVHHMLHKRHHILIAKLDAELKLMKNEIVLTSGIGAPLSGDGNTQGFVGLVVTEAFRRLGINARLKTVPSKLSLLNADRSIDDGVALRIKGIDKTYKNLVRVPETIMCSEFSGYSKNKLASLSSWDSLNKYDISYPNGWRIFENNVIQGKNVRKVNKAETMFNMLNKNRTELVLYEKWQGFYMADKVNIKNIYIYLHQKHTNLIDRVAKSMRSMKEDGAYQKIFDKSLAKFVKNKPGMTAGYYQNVLAGCQ